MRKAVLQGGQGWADTTGHVAAESSGSVGNICEKAWAVLGGQLGWEQSA